MRQFVTVQTCGGEKIRIILDLEILYNPSTNMYEVNIPQQTYAIDVLAASLPATFGRGETDHE